MQGVKDHSRVRIIYHLRFEKFRNCNEMFQYLKPTVDNFSPFFIFSYSLPEGKHIPNLNFRVGVAEWHFEKVAKLLGVELNFVFLNCPWDCLRNNCSAEPNGSFQAFTWRPDRETSFSQSVKLRYIRDIFINSQKNTFWSFVIPQKVRDYNNLHENVHVFLLLNKNANIP